jgi:tetratricopeptide (TPR) repeat protein
MTVGLKNDIMINAIKLKAMKSRLVLLLTVFMISAGTKMLAQDQCATLGSLFIEPAKAKNYEGALPHYDKLVDQCPKYSLAVYQYGEKMFKHFIEEGDKSKVADLEKVYQMRMQHFPSKTEEGELMMKMAQVKYDNEIGSKMDQFNAFDAAFKKDEESFSSPKSLYTYFSLAVDLYNSGEKPLDDIFDLYDIVTQKIEKEEGKLASAVTTLSEKEESGQKLSSKESRKLNANEKNLKAYGTVKVSVDGKLGQLADCENLIPLYEKNFEDNKSNITWLRRAAGRLSAKDCDTPLFFNLVQQLHQLEPSAKSAYYLGKLAERDGNSKTALDYYNQAAELETNPSDKAKVYYSIAENFRKKSSYSSARTYYNKMLEVKPSAGIAYLKIANMIASSANNCGSTVFEKRAIYWKAAQYAERAARVDGSIASSARQTADSYRQRAPSKTDIFSEGMAGKTITFSCWVGGSITVPSL